MNSNARSDRIDFISIPVGSFSSEYSLSGSYQGFYIEDSIELVYISLTVEGPVISEGNYVLTFVEFDDPETLRDNLEAYYCIARFPGNVEDHVDPSDVIISTFEGHFIELAYR